MKSRKILLGLVVLFVVAATMVSACGGAPGDATDEPVAVDGETLLQERCTECHGLDRVTSAEKSREEWLDTVTRMVNRGAELNEAEKEVLVGYLAETYGS
jgi:hypothetical protein